VAPEATTIVTDAAKLHDIARNLIENAVNYTPDGGAIEVQAAVANGQFQLTVADTGRGIAADDLGRVFERFYRVDKSRTTPGTGLGLSIVKHLVHVLDGEVTASNQPGGGALFIVTLPLQQSQVRS
jgi:signal transduction histidine kinase